MGRAVLLFSIVLAAAPSTAPAQRVSTAVVPDAITVGDVFHAAVRVELPPGTEPVFPDTLALTDEDLEAAGRVQLQVDSSAGGRTVTAVYPLTAWRTGEKLQLPEVVFAVRSDGGQQVVRATFPAFTLRSVLPADTAGIEPKPPKDVWGASRLWWPWLIAGALLLVAVAIAWYAWRRRRPRPVAAPAQPVQSPRAAALERLEHARTAGFVERGELKPFYVAITGAVRAYLDAVDPGLGADLTTSELAGRARRRGAPPVLLELLRLLGRADLVKFARARPAAVEAYADLDALRRWVESYDGPVAPAEVRAGRAA